MSVCIRCGEWKQVAMSRCGCGFKPAAGSDDLAKCFILTAQFRSTEALEEARRAIRAGEALLFDDREIELARAIGGWNAKVSGRFLLAAVITGLAAGSIPGRMPLWFILGAAACAVVAFVAAFRLMHHVDRLVAEAKR